MLATFVIIAFYVHRAGALVIPRTSSVGFKEVGSKESIR